MNIQPLINAIRYKLRYGITVEWYNSGTWLSDAIRK